MHITCPLAWLYWNPPRVLFTVPIIDRPVSFYGLLFVFGFIIAYFIVANIFKHILSQTKIQERDVSDWSLLAKSLQIALDDPDSKAFPIVIKLDKKTRQELTQLKLKQEPNATAKQNILSALSDSSLSREQIEKLFPESIVSSNQWGFALTDRMTWFVVLGTLIGSRLGHVFFYDWPRYQDNLLDIFKVWEGGLASHGGTLGILIAIFLYYRLVLKPFPEISFVRLIDIVAIPTGLVCCFIRLGNFINQEILGPPTTMPWGVIFGDPVDRSPAIPRHPSQLYEAAIYLGVFILMMFLWKKKGTQLKPGILSGIFFILVFGSRFFIEFIKMPQSMMMDESYLQMGQILSIPFIILGIFLLFYGNRKEKRA